MAAPSPAAIAAPAFVLLFAMTPDAVAERATSVEGVRPMPDDVSQSYRGRMESLQRRLLGESYSQANQLQRTAVGRLRVLRRAGEDSQLYRRRHRPGRNAVRHR